MSHPPTIPVIVESIAALSEEERSQLLAQLYERHLITQSSDKTPIENTGANSSIACDLDILGGEPCVKGTRISVELILENLAAGRSLNKLLYSYPSLDREGIEAAISYGSRCDRGHTLRQLFEKYRAICRG
ncbi:MAG: DUF433 domain-containing protein [Cyanobacteria bacterium SBLK]|nr:DUF433 domain-containing protein [Cyanobacteria bacterium SBLK]